MFYKADNSNGFAELVQIVIRQVPIATIKGWIYTYIERGETETERRRERKGYVSISILRVIYIYTYICREREKFAVVGRMFAHFHLGPWGPEGASSIYHLSR